LHTGRPVVIPTEAPLPAFVPVPALPPFLLSQESTGGEVEGSGFAITSCLLFSNVAFSLVSFVLSLASWVLLSVKIGKNPHDFQSKTLIPQNKNQNFQKIFNLLSQIELRESQIDIRGVFSHQKCR